MDNMNTIAAAVMRGEYHEVVADNLIKRLDVVADLLMRSIASRDAAGSMMILNAALDQAIKDAADLADAADALVALEDRKLPTTVRLEDAA